MYYTIQAQNKITDHSQIVQQNSVESPKKPQLNRTNLFEEDFPHIYNLIKDNYQYLPSLSDSLMELELKNEEIPETQLPLIIKQSQQKDLKDLQIMQQFIPEDLNKVILGPLALKYGTASCQTINGEFLIVGTQNGFVYSINLYEQSSNVTIIDSTGQEHKFKVETIVSQSQNNSNVELMSFDLQEQILCIGYSNGVIMFVNFQKPSKIKINKETHLSKITLLVNVCQKLWITCDENNRVFAHRLDKGMFSFDLESQELLTAKIESISVLKTQSQIKFFPESRLKNLLVKPSENVGKVIQPEEKNYLVLAMASEEKCWIIRILDYNVAQVLVIIENPDPPQKCIVQWVEGSESLFLFICWGLKLNQYKMDKIVSAQQTLISFDLNKIEEMPQLINHIRSENPNLVSLIDIHGMVSLYTLMSHKIINLFKIPLNKFRISINEQLKQLYLFDSMIVIIKEYSFSEIFQRLLENNDLNACEQVLRFGKSLAIDQAQFDERLLELVSMKIQTFMKKPTLEYLTQFIYMMIQLQKEDLLYKQVFVTITSFMNDEGSFFIECLTEFIQNNLVNYIPEQQLVQIVEGIIKRGKLSLLEKLFIQLDLERANQNLLMHYCMENSLFKPLIQLCTQPGRNNLLIPLFKFQNYYSEKQNSNDYDMCRQYNLRSQAYILLCLQDIRPKDAEMLFDYLFDKTTLTQLMLIDAQSCFQILNRVFYLTTVELIEFTHKHNLDLIIEIVKDIDDHNSLKYFTLFVLNILFNLKLWVSQEIISQIIKFILDNPSTFFLIEPVIYFECLEKQTFTNLLQDIEGVQVMQFIHQKFILQLLLRIKFEDMDTLFKGIHFSDIELVASYIATAEMRYEIAFNIFLQSQNKLIKNQVFQWLEDLIDKQKPIMDLVIKRLNELIKLDLEKTRIIIQRQKNSEASIIEQLVMFPVLQLEYLDHIITQSRKTQQPLSPQIMKQHIILLSQLSPIRMIDELKYNDYPLDEVLKISIKFDNLEAQAYVHERQGASYQSIMIHIGILSKMFDKILSQINSNQDVSLVQYTQVNTKMAQMMTLCINNTLLDSSEDNWYSFLDLLIEYSKKLDKHEPSQSTAFRLVYKKLDNIFEQISLHTPLEIFINSLGERYGKIKIYELRNTFVKIIFNFYYQKNFIYNILSFLRDALGKDFYKGFERHSQGYPIYAYCDYCGLLLNKDQSRTIIFYCGHQLHWDCNSDPHQQRCKKCQEQDYGIYENLANSKQMRMRKLFDKDQIEPRKYSIIKILNQDQMNFAPMTDIHMERKNRLTLFDKNRSKQASDLLKK